MFEKVWFRLVNFGLIWLMLDGFGLVWLFGLFEFSSFEFDFVKNLPQTQKQKGNY